MVLEPERLLAGIQDTGLTRLGAGFLDPCHRNWSLNTRIRARRGTLVLAPVMRRARLRQRSPQYRARRFASGPRRNLHC